MSWGCGTIGLYDKHNPIMHKVLLGFSVAGLLFSGYLSGTKLLTGTCAFNESCPYFFGVPACYIGFVLYALLTVYLVLLGVGVLDRRTALNLVLGVASIGVLYAGYFTLGELPALFEHGFGAYLLGLPTCALGLLFFVAIVVLTIIAKRQDSTRSV